MEWTRRTVRCITTPFEQISSRMWPLILWVAVILASAITLNGQANVTCSSDFASFEEYQAIPYPVLARRAGVHAAYDFELSIIPGGKFSYKFEEPSSDKNGMAYLFQDAIVNSFAGWRFANGARSLKLTVSFQLSGTVRFEDSKVRNQISFNRDHITIKVLATKIVPDFLGQERGREIR
jgi:hypothetical protein